MKKVLLFALLVFWFSCEPRQGQQVQDVPPKSSSSMNEIVAQEVLQATSYTYVKGDENGKEVWMALPKREVELGKTYYFKPDMEMKNFESKDLNRTFESVFFVSALFDSPDIRTKPDGVVPDDEYHKKKQSDQQRDVNIQHEEGFTAIGFLFENKENFENKIVKVKGVVTKYNPGIMNRNWVHIQDGTGGETSFDLTITTKDQISVGSIASFEGIVAINKDFGHGYKYKLIIEQAKLLSRKPEVKIN